MTTSIRAALIATAAAFLPILAEAQQELIFATTNPEQVPLNQGFLIPWAEKINAEAAGILEIDLRHGPMLANHTNFYDRVADDVVQMAWGMTVFNPGRFPRTLVSTLPFLVESSEQGSVALCKMYESGAFDAEFTDIVPLLFAEFPQASLHLNTDTAGSFDALSGKKVITSSPAAAAIVGANGGAPLSFNITEQYEALQRGAADGTILNFTAVQAFRLPEVTTEHLIAPLGGALGMVFISRTAWDGLSDEARTVLKAHSGCDASRGFGQFIDQWEAGAIEMVTSQEGHTLTYATEADVDALIEKLGPGIEAGFAERVPDGAALIAAFKQELAAAK